MTNPTRRDDELISRGAAKVAMRDIRDWWKRVEFIGDAMGALDAIPAANPAQGGEDRQEVLDSFAVEPKHDLATMRAYMNRFPAYAADIAELHIIVTNLAETDRELDAHDYARIEEARQRMFGCNVPPDGWTCSRAKGHDGPCASSPAAVAQETDISRELWAARSTMLDLRYTYSGGMKWSPPPSPAVASDMVLMPRALTAENGAKGLLMGEFHEYLESECQDCADSEDDGCPNCEGGVVRQAVPVEWTTIKAIYAKAVEALAAPAVAREVTKEIVAAVQRVFREQTGWAPSANTVRDALTAALSPPSPLGGGGES